MKVTENREEYVLIERETDQDALDFCDIFNTHDVTLWVSSKGHVDGIKLWKKRSYEKKTLKYAGVGHKYLYEVS